MKIKNKKKRTKNRALRNTEWERGKIRMRVVYRNHKTPVGEVRRNPFNKKAKNSKRFQVAELVECQKQKKNQKKKEGDTTLVTGK